MPPQGIPSGGGVNENFSPGHKDHHIQELNTGRKRRYNDLVKQLESLRSEMKEGKAQLEKLRTDNGLKASSCEEELELNREEAIKYVNEQFDKLVTEINRQKLKVDSTVNEAVAKIKENMVMADSVEETTGKSSNYNNLTDKLETVKNIKVQSFSILTNLETCQSYEYIKIPPSAMGNICGKLVGKDLEIANQNTIRRIFGNMAEKDTAIDLSQDAKLSDHSEESTDWRNSRPTTTTTSQPPVVGTQQLPTMGTQQPPTMGTPQPPTMGTPQPPTMGTPQPLTTGTPQPPTRGTIQPPISDSFELPGMDNPHPQTRNTPQTLTPCTIHRHLLQVLSNHFLQTVANHQQRDEEKKNEELRIIAVKVSMRST